VSVEASLFKFVWLEDRNHTHECCHEELFQKLWLSSNYAFRKEEDHGILAFRYLVFFSFFFVNTNLDLFLVLVGYPLSALFVGRR
jgi:hypothetical protein